MTAFILIATGVVLLIIWGWTQNFRARAAANYEWRLVTDLPYAQTEALIREHLGGANPLAKVTGSLEHGFERRYRHVTPRYSSSARACVQLHPGDDEYAINAWIDEWSFATQLGVADPFFGPAVLRARRKLSQLHEALVEIARPPEPGLGDSSPALSSSASTPAPTSSAALGDGASFSSEQLARDEAGGA